MIRRAAIAVVLLAGCHRDPAAQIVGTWELTNEDAGATVSKYVFAADGTYKMKTLPSLPPEPDDTRRTWKLENGNTLRCYSGGAPSGLYLVTISHDTLTFKNTAGVDFVYARK